MHINKLSRHPEQAPSARAQHDVQARAGRASLVPGASVAAVALEPDINSNLLFAWRRTHLSAQERPPTSVPSGPSPMLLPVTIEAVSVAPCPSPTLAAPRQAAGTIEIDVGGARVRLRGAVDEACVRHVLQTLKALARSAFPPVPASGSSRGIPTEEGIQRPVCEGADGVGDQSLLRPRLRLPRPTRRHAQAHTFSWSLMKPS